MIGFTGGIGLARTNLLLIKGASVLGVRAGEAVRKNPALGEVRLKALTEWAEAGKIRPNISHRLPLEDYAQAMRLVDRSQGDRAGGADDAGKLLRHARGASARSFAVITDRASGLLDQPAARGR